MMRDIRKIRNYFRNIAKIILSGLFLGFFSSAAMADYGYSPQFQPTIMVSNFAKFKGLYVAADFSKIDHQSPVRLQNLSLNGVSIGLDGQDGTLVYGASLGVEGFHLEPRGGIDGDKVAGTLLFRTGFTFDNNNSSILQNTLIYGFGGARIRNIMSVESADTAKSTIRNIVANGFLDKVIGVGIEKKLASMLSIRGEYRYVACYDQPWDVSKWREKGDFTAGVVLRF